MDRKRDGLVPIGDALSDLDGTVPAILEASPQARRGFTQADQVNLLVGASEADADLGFMARLLALCSLPRTNPGNQLQYKRVNGPYKLVMIAGADNKLPYGSLPRLLMAWLSTEAVRTQSRVLVLGKSLSAFMRVLGINTASGRTAGGANTASQSNGPAFSCQCPVDLPGRAWGTVYCLTHRRPRGVLVEPKASR